MRILLAALLLVASGAAALAADPAFGPSLLPPDPGPAPFYGRLWAHPPPDHVDGPRPRRRVMGGPDYVGTTYGLGKPPVLGVGPRPDWGRSTYD